MNKMFIKLLCLLFIVECTKDSSEQLAYPTMCVDEQETGHGRITVVYPDTEYISYKEPHEDEHNCSSFTRLVFYRSLVKGFFEILKVSFQFILLNMRAFKC